jgi:lysylphosphatidylglycerol synthetase-like protein (DUF2156 family)
MEEINFVLLWKEQYEKIDQSLAINKILLKEVIAKKGDSAIQSLIQFKTKGIIAAIIYLILLGAVLFYAASHYSTAANYFIFPMGVIFLINVKALSDYIRNLIWTNNIDFNGNITEVQEKLTRLQLSILRHSRIIVLQLPFWTTFYLSNRWFPNSVDWGYITFQFLFTGSFGWIAYWLYKNQTLENANKKWVKLLIEGSGGKSVLKAIEFSREIESFKQL